MKLEYVINAIVAMKQAEDFMLDRLDIPMSQVTRLTTARVRLEMQVSDIEIPVENDGGIKKNVA